MHSSSPKIKGYLIGIIGGICIAPDALISRLITLDITSLIFWRLLMSSFGFFVIILLLYGKKIKDIFIKWKYPNYVMMIAQPLSPIGFVIGIKYTSVVNVLVIFAMTPIITALISWLIWNKKLSKPTLICMIGAFMGMTLVVIDGVLLSQGNVSGEVFIFPIGEFSAILATFALSFAFCVVNANPEIHYLPSQCLGTFLAALIIAPFNGVWILDAYNFSLVLAIGILVQATASACLFISSKYITSTESALMLLIETIFGPLLVWLFLKEIPTYLALSGGGIILSSLLTNIYFQIKTRPQLQKVPIEYK